MKWNNNLGFARGQTWNVTQKLEVPWTKENIEKHKDENQNIGIWYFRKKGGKPLAAAYN